MKAEGGKLDRNIYFFFVSFFDGCGRRLGVAAGMSADWNTSSAVKLERYVATR